MSNSPLVNYTKISPNRTSPRQDKIRKITIHYMAGDLSVETCGNVFAPKSRRASSNYGIDSKGRIGMYVEEKDRAWTSGSGANDHQAITIEVANKKDSSITDAAYNSLINLCVDICRRNGIKRLNYTGNKSGNLTMHCWFQDTSCPGAWFKKNFARIANDVNKKLGDTGKSGFTLSGANYPTTLQEGNFFTIKGTINSNLKLKRVEVGIVSDVTKKYVYHYDNKSLSGYSFNIANADSKMKFAQLKEGTYYYRIWAWDANGAKKVLDKKFTVKASSSKFTVSGATYPTTIKKGSYFTVKGTVKSNLVMKRVEIGVTNGKGDKWIYKYDKAISSKTFNIHDADATCKFAKLPKGTYYYRGWAWDSNGSHRIFNHKFVVK